jgi:hypothetical protein
VVFIEYPVDSAPYSRNSRFWAAHGGGSVYLPEIIVDSGHRFTNGPEDYYSVYQGMVDAELTRPAEAEIAGVWWRDGDTVQFTVRLTNLSGVLLSEARNGAAVHAVVYEDAHVADTDRFARAAVSVPVSADLAPGAAADFALATPALSGVNWDKLHFVVLADYRPAGTSGAYDMLQAAFARPASFAVEPSTHTFLIDPASPASAPLQVSLTGPDGLTWSATMDVPWLLVSPASGSTASPPLVSVDRSTLVAGWQEGHVDFEAAGGGSEFSDQILVRAYLGPVTRVNLPLVVR